MPVGDGPFAVGLLEYPRLVRQREQSERHRESKHQAKIPFMTWNHILALSLLPYSVLYKQVTKGSPYSGEEGKMKIRLHLLKGGELKILCTNFKPPHPHLPIPISFNVLLLAVPACQESYFIGSSASRGKKHNSTTAGALEFIQ